MELIKENLSHLNKKSKIPFLYQALNEEFMEWNPLGVEGAALQMEYFSYLPQVIKNSTNINNLVFCLEKIISTDMGLDYSLSNVQQKADLLAFANKIMQVIKGKS